MKAVFQRHLKPLDGRNYEVRECSISHTRYRVATRCMLQYTLRLVEPTTRRERSQLVTGTIYAGGRARKIWEELRRSDLGSEISGASPTFVPFFYISDLDMLVQVFPYDRRLPTLPLLMEGRSTELEPLLLASFGTEDWQVDEWSIEPVRYLTERRATLRLRVQARDIATGRAEEKRFIAKVYDDERMGEQTFEILRSLWEKAGAGGTGFTVGRPITYLSGLRTLIQEEVSGISLKDMLLRGDEATSVMREVARALAALHLGRTATPRRLRLRDTVADLERVSRFLQRFCPHLKSEIEVIVGAVVAGLEEVPPAPTHGDLKPDHIMLDGNRLVLMDLDDFAEADPVLDVARFSTLLVSTPLHFPPQHDLPRAFAEEYFAHVPKTWHTRLPLYYAGACLKHAFSLSRYQSPGWSDKVEVLVKEAGDSVAGKIW
jgi:hypothetical protein